MTQETTLATELKERIEAAQKEADDIRYYSGGSNFNASLHSLADWIAFSGGGNRILAALSKPAVPDVREAFQNRVDGWMDVCFGDAIKADMLERADRFCEEALELVQTVPQFSAERAHALVDYVFNRPVGVRFQEVGGVRVTLSALCNADDINEDGAAETELARIWTKVDQIRAKQATKPVGSALPVALTPQATRPCCEAEREADLAAFKRIEHIIDRHNFRQAEKVEDAKLIARERIAIRKGADT